MAQLYTANSSISRLSAKVGTTLSQARKLYHIVFVERRIPGRALRLYYRFLDSLGVHKTEVVTSNGFVIEGMTNSLWMYHETWDKDDYGIPGFKLSPGMTVIDVGANQGFYSLYAASMGARVLAFEPSTASFEILLKNIERNSLSKLIKCFNMAVTAKSGVTQFYEGFDDRDQFLSSTASIVDENRGGSSVLSTTVAAISIDDIFRENGIELCDFLKMDCEGAEYQILEAATDYSLGKIRYIVLEFHDGKVDMISKILETAGFEILQSVDAIGGLIKAKNKMR